MGGGGGYDRDVCSGSSSSRSNFNFSRDTSRQTSSRINQEKRIDENLDPKKAMKNGWECREIPGETDKVTPVALLIDLTKTRGEDIIPIYDKTPLLIGQIVMKGYADHPELSICGVADVQYDQFGIQISDFESDLRIDRNLKALIIEEGGGGNGVESYLTALYAYARHSFLDCLARGKKGYLFILGDEGFYPLLSKQEIKKIFGVDVPDDLPAEKIFTEVQEKYHVVYIYFKKDEKKRKEGIEAEIKKRVKERGGMYEDVDIRASLIWSTCDDLDLHMVAPSGEEIFFRNKTSQCGGSLDIDTNAGDCITRKAVENIRYKKGKAPKGNYKVFVQNFAYHDPETKMGEIPFTLELMINGKSQIFEGVSAAQRTGRASDVTCFEFYYDPKAKDEDKVPEDPYAAYADDKILEQWRSMLPEENVIVIEDPKAFMDVILGFIALEEGKRSLESYDQDLNDRDQSDERRAEVRGALSKKAQAGTNTNRPEAAALPKKKKR